MNTVSDPWSPRIHRAEQLALASSPAQHLVAFYATLLGAQFEVYRALATTASTLTGDLPRDLPTVRPALAPVLDAVAAVGPGELAQHALEFRAASGALDARLLAYWHSPSDTEFFAKACLQPYARRMVDEGVPIPYDDGLAAPNRCPACAGRPQVAFISGGPASGGARSLLCARCLSPWTFKRVTCAHCGQEDGAQLGYHRSPDWEHVRVDTCDTCRHYVKTVDLTILGLADPLVDDVASAALDLWAVEHGYVKVERNLVGL